jgi:hypothetical protein
MAYHNCLGCQLPWFINSEWTTIEGKLIVKEINIYPLHLGIFDTTVYLHVYLHICMYKCNKKEEEYKWYFKME